jgi:hypothetical protein
MYGLRVAIERTGIFVDGSNVEHSFVRAANGEIRMGS